MELEPHPRSRRKALLTPSDDDEKRILRRAMKPLWRPTDWSAYNRLVFRESEDSPITVTKRQLGRVAAGIRRNLKGSPGYLEVGGNLDDFRPGELYFGAEFLLDQIENFLSPPSADILPFRRRVS